MADELNRRQMLGASSAAAATGLLLAPSITWPAASADPDDGPAEDAEHEAEELRERTVVVAGVSAVTSLDPALAVDTETERVCRQVFEGLLGIDQETGATRPLLARDWDVDDDGLVYTFQLRQGVVFHDGTALTADSVVANVERWGRLDELYGTGNLRRTATLPFESLFGGYLGDETCVLDSVEAEDESTVVLTLSEPIVFLPQALTLPAFGIASPEVLSDSDPDLVSRSPIGTGAYRVTEAADGDVVMEAFEDYWNGAVTAGAEDDGPAGPPPERVEVRAVPRSFDRLRDLQRGQVDVYDYITADNLRPLVQSGRMILQRDPFSILYLGFNLEHPIMEDRRMREAAARAVDRSALIDGLFLDGTRPAHQFTPASLGVHSESAERYGRDLEEARALLEAAGYDGEPLRFHYPMNATRSYLPRPEAVYASIARDLTRVGFVVQPHPVPWDSGYLEEVLEDEDRAMHLLGRNGGYRSPHSFFGPLFQRTSREFGYDSEEVRDLLLQARGETDEEDRAELYREVADIVAEDLPAMPLVHPISGLALGRRVSDYPMSPVLFEPFREIRMNQV
ncbi:ABC transporter substrate-binding protein [Nesterenkonia xinjiangensis]|uniref:Peptide/nickel transport system substrate-binding protein n=1 Tax=Nesterenkonia xinjiangensis TaxID=225327 RepID=A0A7Z0GII2_9MICC|nr:ABC transporter substrate-binding protein [Nesterenkonia xinjiangensis]NYJ76630.1 peptide/nickel transport system substrate-binding protein [Nesterenkonia xinjiangensis]